MENKIKSIPAVLRQKAEELLKKKSSESGSQFPESDFQQLIHELQVHQVELEMQNEELTRAKLESEVAREKYQELYDFAPSGYFTLSREGEILELNLCASQMLGKERSLLINSRLGFFISDNTKPRFNDFLEKVFNSRVKECCEVIFAGNEKIIVHLNGIVSDQGVHCLLSSVDITETKVSEEALKRSNLLLNSSLESQKDTILLSIDLNYRYLYFNKAHREIMMCAYNKEVKLGLNILDCISSADDRIIAKENYDRALKGESHSNIWKYGDVQVDWYESFFNPILNEKDEIIGATALALNITKRKESEELVRISEEKYRKLLELATDAFFQGNSNEDFIAVNNAAIEMTGFSKEELLQMNMKDLFPVETLSDKPFRYDQLRKGRTINSERDLLRKDGIRIIVEMNSRIMPDGTFQSFFRDITERKRIEKALNQKLSEMEIYYELAITRERKMIALKSEINLLLQRLGEEPKY